MDEIWMVFGVLGPLVFIGLITWVGIRLFQDYQQRKRALASIHEVTGGNLVSEKIYEASAEGFDYRYEYWAGSRGRPAYFRVFLDCPSHGEFKLAKETGFDRFCKRLGIASEVQTGDDAFDRDFYITSPDSPFCDAFFGSAPRRELLREIFAAGFTSVSHDGKTIEARWEQYTPDSNFDPAFVLDTARRLAALTNNIPETPPAPRDASAVVRRWLFYGIAIGLGVFWMLMVVTVGAYRPLDEGWTFFLSLGFSIPLLALFLWCAIWALKGRSSSHRELLTLALIALFTFPLAGWATTRWSNGALDRGEPATHEALVIDKETTRHKKSTSYHARLQSWRPGEDTIRLTINSTDHGRITPHQTRATVVTKPGFWGVEWIASVRFEPLPRGGR